MSSASFIFPSKLRMDENVFCGGGGCLIFGKALHD